jgi:hypothetical protein
MVSPEELNFVDKLHKSLEIVGKKQNRAYLIIYGLSFLLIFFSLKIIEPGKELALEWINIKMNISILMIIISIILTFVMMNCYSLIIEQDILSTRIENIYKSYNLKIDNLSQDYFDYLSYPDLIGFTINDRIFKGNKIGEFLYLIAGIIFYITLLSLPIVSQILCLINLLKVYGCTWWLLLIYIILFIIDAIISVLSTIQYYKQS